MTDLQLTVKEAQRQLAELERQADSLLTTLSSTVVDGSANPTPHNIVTNSMNALKGYEAAIIRLQPVLDSVATRRHEESLRTDPVSPAVLEALWKRSYPGSRAFLHSRAKPKQTTVLPSQPATTLEALMAAFQENFPGKIKFEISKHHKEPKALLSITFPGIFRAQILLDPLESVEISSIINILPSDIDITQAEPGSTDAATPPPLFIQQLKAAAITAVLELKNKNTVAKTAESVELLILWLVLCAAQIKGSHTHPRLKLDLPTGTYVPLFPNFSKLTWKEAWEQATQAL